MKHAIFFPNRRLFAVIVLAILLASGASAPCRASDSLVDELTVAGDAQLLSSADMQDMRAGFIDPSGLIFRFAVDIKAQIDGALTYVRSLVLQATPTGFQATTETKVLTENLPSGTSATVVNNGGGVVVSSANGDTTLINQTEKGGLTNIIVNTADNRTISQTLDVDLVLQNVQTTLGLDVRSKGSDRVHGLMHVGRFRSWGLGR